MKHTMVALLISWFLAMIPFDEFASFVNLGPQDLVQADGVDIKVAGYSVPSVADWNNDGLSDLIIGEGSSIYTGKVRVYLNVETQSYPQFTEFFYAQSNGFDLIVPTSGCLGSFPRVVYWDADTRKDLLVGLANGTVKIFLNIGTDENPTFDGGKTVQVGSFGVNLDVGSRATPAFVDWNSDGMMDLVVGALDGKIHIYLNCDCNEPVPPHFNFSGPTGDFAQEDGSDLVVPSRRSSPVVLDLNGDGRKDLLTGNTEGQLIFYPNVGTDEEPMFSGFLYLESNGFAINLPGSPRSRPFVCFWTDDGYPDVLIGAADGKVHLFQGIPEIGDINLDGSIDFVDFALFAVHWQRSDCEQCSNVDFTGDGKVNIDDLSLFAANWLKGPAIAR